MNGGERVVSAGRFAGLSRAALARIPQMTVILARHASAVRSICYVVRSQPQPIILVSRIVNKLTVIMLARDLWQQRHVRNYFPFALVYSVVRRCNVPLTMRN